MQRHSSGFSLIEIMIVVAVIGILSAIAVPAYGGYVMRARLTEAFGGLAGVGPVAEQYWSNNRTYANVGDVDAPTAKLADRLPPNTANFTFALSDLTVTTYTVTATGRAAAAGFKFTINQSGTRATTEVPTGWTLTANNTCWIDRKEGTCTQ